MVFIAVLYQEPLNHDTMSFAYQVLKLVYFRRNM